MSTDRALTEFDVAAPNREPVEGQTTTRDLSVLDAPGDCRSCGGDVDDEVLRIAGRDGRVDGCAGCFEEHGRTVASDSEAALRAHRNPTWPRDRGGGE